MWKELPARSFWSIGQRVERESNEQLGTIVGVVCGTVKVKWDSGATSYYKRNAETSVSLADEKK